MIKTGVLILGTKGMLGSMVKKVFEQEGIEFDEVNHKDDGWDARNPQTPDKWFDYEWIINCIGRIKPTIDENDQKSVWGTILVNSEFPYRLNETGAKVIQIATDCVYDGQRGRYAEDDLHNATDVYGKTKSLGEVPDGSFFNIRCSIIGPGGEGSLFEWFMNQPLDASIQGYTNHIWNGVTTLAYAKLCAGMVKNNLKHRPSNLQHFVPADTVTKAQLLKKMAHYFGRNDIKITEVKADQRADRSLITNWPTENQVYWLIAGYKTVPTVNDMLEELNNFMEEK